MGIYQSPDEEVGRGLKWEPINILILIIKIDIRSVRKSLLPKSFIDSKVLIMILDKKSETMRDIFLVCVMGIVNIIM